ncbi:MAG: hypothetical protein EA400_01005 [Chromatiaceae bacterium]|nr:MAG: hypothetical protein EA400_01005 [Chromatiaceae bacterium]
MSINRYQKHILVLPEDDANRQLAVGFVQHPTVRPRSLQILGPAGGWPALRDQLHHQQLPGLARFQNRQLLLLCDFDERPTRRAEVLGELPATAAQRVFVVGVWSEPEDLRTALGHRGLEAIGQELADHCCQPDPHAEALFEHPLLRYNRDEVARMAKCLRPFVIAGAGCR